MRLPRKPFVDHADNYIYDEINNNLNPTTLATMYLDFEKAIDKVSHGKILEKKTNTGIRGGVLELNESYLKGRKQKVKIGLSVSSEFFVQSGVPQGSVLGLFL